jgi:hypothetical protein
VIVMWISCCRILVLKQLHEASNVGESEERGVGLGGRICEHGCGCLIVGVCDAGELAAGWLSRARLPKKELGSGLSKNNLSDLLLADTVQAYDRFRKRVSERSGDFQSSRMRL